MGLSRTLAAPERRYCYLVGGKKRQKRKEKGKKKKAKRTQGAKLRNKGGFLDQLCWDRAALLDPGWDHPRATSPRAWQWGMFALYKTKLGCLFFFSSLLLVRLLSIPFVSQSSNQTVWACVRLSPPTSLVPCVLLLNSCSDSSQI